MKQNLVLSIMSVLLVLLMTFHLAGDIVFGFENGGPSILIALPILAVCLYGALALGERRSGCVILLLGSLIAMAVPTLHMKGKGVGAEIATASGGFFFIWTLLALGVIGLAVLLLSVRGLWGLRRTTSS